jgi:RNA polymerase sigma-70 factor (ECF subfamily)
MSVADLGRLGAATRVDEETLVAALRAGEGWAFEVVVRTYGGRLLGVARRYARCDADAQDIVQSSYLNAFRAMSRFEGQSQLFTWLHRIVVNTALMRIRSRRRKPEESIEELLPRFQEDGHHTEQFADWAAPADELLQREHTRATVRAAIDRLPGQFRSVLLLRDIDEFSTQEVAEMLGATTTAIKVRLHRARQALAKLLSADFARPPVTPDSMAHPSSCDAGESPR